MKFLVIALFLTFIFWDYFPSCEPEVESGHYQRQKAREQRDAEAQASMVRQTQEASRLIQEAEARNRAPPQTEAGMTDAQRRLLEETIDRQIAELETRMFIDKIEQEVVNDTR